MLSFIKNIFNSVLTLFKPAPLPENLVTYIKISEGIPEDKNVADIPENEILLYINEEDETLDGIDKNYTKYDF
jgi:hypothetical protein